jgi:hypothetical protein
MVAFFFGAEYVTLSPFITAPNTPDERVDEAALQNFGVGL